jgi:acyl-CoA reductase-like NAD-dependent aldehyde dehydrogenase
MVEARDLVGYDRQTNGALGVVEVFAPYDGKLVGTAPISGPERAEEALKSSVEAFSSWRFAPNEQRQGLVRRISLLVAERAQSLAELLAVEVGKPITWAKAEVKRLELTFKLAGDLLDEPQQEELSLDFDPRGKDYRCFVVREPVGPVFGIVPYNWPFNLAAHKLAPALAAGCTVILKPSRLAPLSTLALIDLVVEAGCPKGVVNCIVCENDVAESIVKDGRIALVSFTGSPKVGWHLKNLVPEKRVTLEMGGDASTLIFDDADLDLAVERTVMGKYGYAGQICISVQHTRVQSGVYDEVRDRLVTATEQVKTGDPMDDKVVCGPVIGADAAERIMEWIDEAERAGGTVLCGGNRVGNMIEPTIVENVPAGCKLAEQEVFGPVMTLSRFETEEEAFELVNSSQYGIHCGVFTADENRHWRALRQLEVSGVIANDFPTLRFDNMPYGGVKRSGFGREGVRYTFEEYTTPKVLLQRR